MKILRTPEKRFVGLTDYPFKPNYCEVEGIRIHYVDEGPSDANPVLLMHGEPSWSYLYRHIIPIIAKNGYRVVAPDLVGFGKSDKPSKKSDHSYRNHVSWIDQWLKKVDLHNITMFCQDWGSLIGLRVAAQNQDKFSRIILANGGLPAPTPKTKMPKAFKKWLAFSKYSPILPIGKIIQLGTYKTLPKRVIKGYKAPFPSNKYKAGARIFPSLVPMTPDDPETAPNQKAWEIFSKWNIPFLTAFSNKDPITRGGAAIFQKLIPGAQGLNHLTIKNAGHFLQEEKGEEIAKIILDFMSHTS
ncbi:MAG: haloalkane dehalogenase [Promethearchaeota archaeon]